MENPNQRGSRTEGEAAVLIISAWRDPSNAEIRDCFAGNILLFDAFVRAAASGHAHIFSRKDDATQAKLDPIILRMREIDF